MLDIRSAKQPAGATPPQHISEAKSTTRIADINESGNTVIEDFNGDLVIAGYMEFLEKNGINREDIFLVLESILASGSVVYSFNFLDKIPVKFVARPAWVDQYITKEIDGFSSRISNATFSNIVGECNLAASMTQYGDETYSINSEADLEKARERVRAMPYMIVASLIKKLAVFDRVLACAMSDWAVKNFTTPRKEKSEQD